VVPQRLAVLPAAVAASLCLIFGVAIAGTLCGGLLDFAWAPWRVTPVAADLRMTPAVEVARPRHRTERDRAETRAFVPVVTPTAPRLAVGSHRAAPVRRHRARHGQRPRRTAAPAAAAPAPAAPAAAPQEVVAASASEPAPATTTPTATTTKRRNRSSQDDHDDGDRHDSDRSSSSVEEASPAAAPATPETEDHGDGESHGQGKDHGDDHEQSPGEDGDGHGKDHDGGDDHDEGDD
jgi:hypothetical protein